MDCPGVSAGEWAERYLRDELSAPLRDEFELHYLGCRPCFEEVQLRLAVQLALGTTGDPAASAPSADKGP